MDLNDHFDDSSAPLDDGAINESGPSKQTASLHVSRKVTQVSPAFADAILWPHESSHKKKTARRLPFATTSKQWMQSFQDKEKGKKRRMRKRRRTSRKE